MYELAFRISRGAGTFSYTRVVTIMPRYVLINHSPFDLEVTQSGLHLSTEQDDWLQLPGCAADDLEQGDLREHATCGARQIVWHWPSARLKRTLRLRVAGGGWLPSASISLHGEPGAPRVAARPTYGCSPTHLRLQPGPPTVAGEPGEMMDMVKSRPEHDAAQAGQVEPASGSLFTKAELASGCLFSVEQEEHDGVRFVKIYRGRREDMLYILQNELHADPATYAGPLLVSQVGELSRRGRREEMPEDLLRARRPAVTVCDRGCNSI